MITRHSLQNWINNNYRTKGLMLNNQFKFKISQIWLNFNSRKLIRMSISKIIIVCQMKDCNWIKIFQWTISSKMHNFINKTPNWLNNNKEFKINTNNRARTDTETVQLWQLNQLCLTQMAVMHHLSNKLKHTIKRRN